MSIEQCVCVCIGVIVQGVTFILGIMVGISMQRKGFSHGDSNVSASWHQVERR